MGGAEPGTVSDLMRGLFRDLGLTRKRGGGGCDGGMGWEAPLEIGEIIPL